jgi:hypothetical protein
MRDAVWLAIAKRAAGSSREPAAVILAVIPPGTTCKTGRDQADGTANLTCEDGTGRDPLDGR